MVTDESMGSSVDETVEGAAVDWRGDLVGIEVAVTGKEVGAAIGDSDGIKPEIVVEFNSHSGK